MSPKLQQLDISRPGESHYGCSGGSEMKCLTKKAGGTIVARGRVPWCDRMACMNALDVGDIGNKTDLEDFDSEP